MPVTVSPETFTLVGFDAPTIAAIAEQLVADIGLAPDIEVRIEVDERTPLGRAKVASVEPLVIAVESGALEDPKHPRQLSRDGSADVLGRLLLQVRDRLDPDFGDVAADDEIPLPHSVAWDVYAIGRLVRLGYHNFNQRQRRLYHFRNRHGFTDAADEAFDRLWTAERLSWAEITSISDSALAAREPASA